MSLCINPNCQNPDNPDNLLRCQSCGSELLLEGCYRVTRSIGKGGFAKTFEVNDSGKLKILKVLTLNQTKVVSLFQQEAEVLKRLNHPGIPNAEEYFQFFPQNSQEPVHCLVMDKIDGEDLHKWLEKRGNRPISEKLAVLWLTLFKPVKSVAISSNSKILVSASEDKTIIVWNLNTGEQIYTLSGHSDTVSSVAISPDGQTVVSGSDDEKIKVWNLSDGQEVYTVNGHLDGVNALAFSPDGQILVSGGKDTTIKVWRMN